MDSAVVPNRHSAAAECVDSSSVLVSESLLTPPQQLSFAAAVSSPSALQHGGSGLLPVGLRYAMMCLIMSEDDLTVCSLRNPN